ncbi:hypothetical protein BCR44DRAFT_1431218 [Catenaria anguillulae PL171]|uniref:ASX DEUBAD domain-containing protein n=1 Tax=Catenaria anguillulae PL171 TaxID=765915 RepID=A0A1Y2HTD6_9FUNG|nr:hypothetical protein BCR44DRAFT_1431218 [Catenaria anguillulae PL171]
MIMKPKTAVTTRITRSRAKASASPATDHAPDAQPPSIANEPAMASPNLLPSPGHRRRPTTATPRAAAVTKSNVNTVVSRRTRRGGSDAQDATKPGLNHEGSSDDLTDLSELSDSDGETTNHDLSSTIGNVPHTDGGISDTLPPLPDPARQTMRRRPSTAAVTPNVTATSISSKPPLPDTTVQPTPQEPKDVGSTSIVEDADMDITSSVDSSVVLDVDDTMVALAAAATSPIKDDPAPVMEVSYAVADTSAEAAHAEPPARPRNAQRRGQLGYRPSLLPRLPQPIYLCRLTRQLRALRAVAKKRRLPATWTLSNQRRSLILILDCSRPVSDNPDPPPTKKLKAKSQGPGRLPTIISTQSTPVPLANLKQLTSKKRLPHIQSLLKHSDPEWIATAQDSPIALLDSLDWIINDDAWRALSPKARQRLLSRLPACDKTPDGQDLVPGFWSSPAVVHQAVVYPDYVRAGMVVPILADSVNVEPREEMASDTAEAALVDADGDSSMPDGDTSHATTAPAPALPKPISELRIMKALTGDLDPSSLPITDTDREWLLALVGDETGDDDAWKDENFERFWGDLDESLMRANRSRAGESTNVTLKHLFAVGMLKVGDVIWYRRKWMTPQPVAVELDLKVTKFQASSGFCTTVVLRDSYKHLSDATNRAKPTSDMGLPSKANEELVWKAPNQLEATIWSAVAPGHKRPNGNAWRDMRRLREDEDEDEQGVWLFKLRHDYLDEHQE